mgnify:CR=1 FL=1
MRAVEPASSTYCDGVSSEEQDVPMAATQVPLGVTTLAHDLLCIGAQFD